MLWRKLSAAQIEVQSPGMSRPNFLFNRKCNHVGCVKPSGTVEGTWTANFASSHESNICLYLYLTFSRWHSTDRVCVWMFYSKSPCTSCSATAVLEDAYARICVFMFTETHVWEEESAGAPLDLINEVADSRYISGQVTASLLQVHRCAQQLLIYETVSKPSANIREKERERESAFFLQWASPLVAKVKAECRSPLRDEKQHQNSVHAVTHCYTRMLTSVLLWCRLPGTGFKCIIAGYFRSVQCLGH